MSVETPAVLGVATGGVAAGTATLANTGNPMLIALIFGASIMMITAGLTRLAQRSKK